jgi:formate hydrogenlyase transcriptional activator
MDILKKCNGRIWGPRAAAELMNILPSSQNSKMKKLGIKKRIFKITLGEIHFPE